MVTLGFDPDLELAVTGVEQCVVQISDIQAQPRVEGPETGFLQLDHRAVEPNAFHPDDGRLGGGARPGARWSQSRNLVDRLLGHDQLLDLDAADDLGRAQQRQQLRRHRYLADLDIRGAAHRDAGDRDVRQRQAARAQAPDFHRLLDPRRYFAFDARYVVVQRNEKRDDGEDQEEHAQGQAAPL